MPRQWGRMGVLVVGVLTTTAGSGLAAGMTTPQAVAKNIATQDAASARLELDGKVVYFDPFFDEKAPAPAADLILITHGHDRHCSPGTVARILKADTVIVAPASCAQALADVAKRSITTPMPGKTISAVGVTVESVPAYTPDNPDHARDTGGVGYVLTIDGVRVYHSGSTALVPELKTVRADVALLAFWEGYILSTQDAASLARSLGVKVVIPIHCKPEEAVKLRDMLQPAIQVDVRTLPQA